MIKKLKIQALINWYHNNSWLFQLLFLFYFTISLTRIGMMKMEISKIEVEIDNYFDDSKTSIQYQLSNCSSYLQKRPSAQDTYNEIKNPLDFVQSQAFLNSEDLRGELDDLQNQFQEQLEINDLVFKMDQNHIRMANEYPILKKYISSKYATDMMNIMYWRLSRSDCGYYCRYFNPIIQKFGDDYFLYPNVLSSGGIEFPEITVNGEKIHDFNYKFQPERRGMHTLDIEYSYFYQLGKEVIKFRKGLMVR